MTDIKMFIKVEVEKEQPKEAREYFTDQGCINWSGDRWYAFSPTWWLKEYSLTELMIEFAYWLSDNADEETGYPALLTNFLTEKQIIKL